MCNLYRMSRSQDEVAHFFDSHGSDLAVGQAGNATAMIYPGYPGLVLAEDAVQQMVWGFPLVLKGAKGQPLKPKPVNNARADKLGSPFWSASFRARRCLVPVSAFAEAAGPKGGKTRTWFALPDSPLLAVGGLWRDSAEWGRAYAMVMTDANAQVRPLHERMPVIVPQAGWKAWLYGTPDEAFALCRPYAGEMQVEHTDEPWVARR